MRTDLTELSYKRLLTLHPQLQASAFKCYDKCISRNIPIYITWARRTKEEQSLLYRFGRTLPGKIYTYHRAEFSPYCYGLAIDFCLYNDQVFYEWPQCEPHKYWRWMWIKVMKTFEQDGWISGWRWTDFQPGSLENLLGKTMLQHEEEARTRAAKDRDYWGENL